MSNMNEQNQIPQSIEAEQAVLGALLLSNDSIDKIGDLQAKHFVREDHRAIFGQIVRMIANQQPADVVTVWAAMEGRQTALTSELGPYLNQLRQSVPSSVHIAQYASTVVDRALMRGILHVADKVSGLVQNPQGKTADDMLEAMQSLVTTLAERRVKNEPRMIAEVLQDVIDGIGKRAEGHEYAMSTGIGAMDLQLNGGLRPGQLVIVAGRPSMGKTALTSDIGLNMAECVFRRS